MITMRILLAGATGVIGRQFLPRLTSDGHEVFAMTRSTSQIGHLQAVGAKPIVCDVFDKRWIIRRRCRVSTRCPRTPTDKYNPTELTLARS